MKNSGFTILELLVVVMVLGLLMGLVGSVVISVRDTAWKTDTETTIHILGDAVLQYKMETRGFYPMQKSRGASLTSTTLLFYPVAYDNGIEETEDTHAFINALMERDIIDLPNMDHLEDNGDGSLKLVDSWGEPILYQLGDKKPVDIDAWNPNDLTFYCYLYSKGPDPDNPSESYIYASPAEDN